MGGGGQGEQLFLSDWVWDTTEGERGDTPSHGGDFFFFFVCGNSGIKNQVLGA